MPLDAAPPRPAPSHAPLASHRTIDRYVGASYSNDTWRLWSFPWHADSPGSHTITVRATDNTGAVQTEQWADPVPDGASGWHSVSFTVT